MNIAFKGLQNAAAYSKENKNYPDSRLDRIAVQLNNNGPNKDLDNFQDILQKFPDFDDDSFIDLEFKTNPIFEESKTGFDVFVNSKKVEWEDKNLPIFAKVFDIVKRLAKGEENIPLHKDYPESWECVDRFYSQLYGKTYSEQKKFLNTIHDTDYVAAIANYVAKPFSNAINTFCIQDPKPAPYDKISSASGFYFDNGDFCIKKIYIELNEKSKEKYSKIADEFPARGNQNNLDIEIRKDAESDNTKVYLNGYKLNIEEANFEAFRTINEILTDISNTEKNIPFPKNYVSLEHFDRMSEDSLTDGAFDNFFAMPDDIKELSGIKGNIIKDNQEIRALAADLIYEIKNKFEQYYS